MSEAKPVILTCAQPTGQLTIGNYLGAVKNWATMLDDYECYFGVVDMHAITVKYSPAELRKNTLSCVAQYIACGLDPERSNIFVQSHVIGHTELAWLLSCITPIGDLQRMTQFKEKAASLGFKVADDNDLKFTHDGARAGASVNSVYSCIPSSWRLTFCSTRRHCARSTTAPAPRVCVTSRSVYHTIRYLHDSEALYSKARSSNYGAARPRT